MSTQPDHDLDTQHPDTNNFVLLVFGLELYLQNEQCVPNSLRRVLNALACEWADQSPKTLYQFIDMCHQPVAEWYPLTIPDDFNPSQPILYDRRLSEEAQDFYLTLTEQMELHAYMKEIPQAALDNLKMIAFRRRLKASSDSAAAQALYVQVRSFLIEHSWTTLAELRAQPLTVLRELREFYEALPPYPVTEIVVCERCGLLNWRHERWYGIKPSFCSDHGSGSPYIHAIRNTDDLHRLREGIHLRTFLPGKLEQALFEGAEQAQAQYPDHLLSIERYPGLDTYDLRLTFSDEVWAVDAKDHARPERLAAHIRPLYNEGSLSHTHAFYVIPDARMNDVNYREQLEARTNGTLSPYLHIRSLSAFQQRVEEKLKALTNPPRQKKSKKA